MVSTKRRSQSEELSERALEILHLLEEGLSDREIAERLTLSVNTVKWYNRQIYSVLDVGSRTQAVARANELKLLDQDDRTEQHPNASFTSPKHNLPADTTRFIGREREITDIKRMMLASRLMTLAGPPGTGKTRLSLHVARELAEIFPDGVYFVSLAPINDPLFVANAIATAIGVKEVRNEPLIDTLKYVLHNKRLLLVVDNFEHLLEAAPLISDLLSATEHLKVLITSREVLRIYGEQEYKVPLMELPDPEYGDPSELAACESVILFVERAKAVRPDFDLTRDNALDIAKICVRLEGLPLAIELAAARIKLLTLKELLSRLGSRLEVLVSGPRDHSARQQTLRHTIDWSYDLLNDEEKCLFSRLAVFRRGCSLNAIDSVCVSGMSSHPLEDIESLLNKSLVHRDAESGRFTMHEFLQQYAEEQLQKSGEFDAICLAHSRYYADLLAEYEPHLFDQHLITTLKTIETELENIRHGINWAIEHSPDHDYVDRQLYVLGMFFYLLNRHAEANDLFLHIDRQLVDHGVRQAGRLLWRIRVWRALFLVMTHHYSDGKTLAQDCLNRLMEDPVDHETIMSYLGLIYANMMQANYETALEYSEKASKLATQIGYTWAILVSQSFRAYTTFLQGDAALAKRIQRQVIEDVQSAELSPLVMAAPYNNLAEFHHMLREDDIARPLFEQSYRIYTRIRDRHGMAVTLNNLGDVSHSAAQYGDALQYNQESLDLYREIGDRRGVADALMRLAHTRGNLGQIADRDANLKEAVSIFEAIGDPAGMGNALVLLGHSTIAVGKLRNAEKYFERSLNVRREVGNPVTIVDSLQMLAVGKLKSGKIDDAQELLNESMKLIEDENLDTPESQARYRAFQSQIRLRRHQFGHAISISEPYVVRKENDPPPFDTPLYALMCGVTAIAHFRLQQYGETRHYGYESLWTAANVNSVFAGLTGLSALAGLLSTLEKQHEQAVEILSLAQTASDYRFIDPESVALVLEIIQPHLTAAQYKQAFERGKYLDLESVAQELLARFKEE